MYTPSSTKGGSGSWFAYAEIKDKAHTGLPQTLLSPTHQRSQPIPVIISYSPKDGLVHTSMSHVAVSPSKVSLTRGEKNIWITIKDIVFQFTRLLNLRTNTPPPLQSPLQYLFASQTHQSHVALYSAVFFLFCFFKQCSLCCSHTCFIY